jgi:hypothetical protein
LLGNPAGKLLAAEHFDIEELLAGIRLQAVEAAIEPQDSPGGRDRW